MPSIQKGMLLLHQYRLFHCPYARYPTDRRAVHPGMVQEDYGITWKDMKGLSADTRNVNQRGKIDRSAVSATVHPETIHGPKDPPTMPSSVAQPSFRYQPDSLDISSDTFISIASLHYSPKKTHF